MPSLKDLKNRIASVKATQKITKAMQMVAAAKLRRAQSAAEDARPYAERMDEVLANVAASVAGDDSAPALLAGTGSDQNHLLLVCTAERGLCGGFNSSIARLARAHARSLKAEGKTVKILCVGKKGFDVLKNEFGDDIIDVVDMRDVKHLRFNDAEMRVGRPLLFKFEKGEFDVCTLFYARFQSVVTQVPTAQQIIPAVFEEKADGEKKSGAIYEYEPGEEEILADLLPRNVSVQIYRALLENGASEQGARMSAMDNATRNAGEMIGKLEMSYNRQRQAQITNELIEIISGAEAL
ncbi:F-type H+-transporting ATPase subunit gamma [Cohaesibacter sp. ES.047]|uniref:F0F1 ATP synthase subunit gamma n=1 Tax=Cohaesibacter sp. ES.047 TaxID=1798205 RepID=UPI000BB7A5C9|nr:F0F1 ATP synthase subunit gamma [Cohaesibacter sp. ES.047]SNY90674.1 F-type H+-transporting ATPase subunit gamma [Cohaesibacter sp. ES.047]